MRISLATLSNSLMVSLYWLADSVIEELARLDCVFFKASRILAGLTLVGMHRAFSSLTWFNAASCIDFTCPVVRVVLTFFVVLDFFLPGSEGSLTTGCNSRLLPVGSNGAKS